MTYPDAEVIQFVNDHFATFKADSDSGMPDVRRLYTRYRTLWQPGFVLLDSTGAELRRWVGFLPPREFIGELCMGLGKAQLLHTQPEKALGWFTRASDVYPDIDPEATYWAAIAAYKISKDRETLRVRWARIRERHPESTWWRRADVFD